ncbi:pro-Pol polyprotein [Trichonephila clavipes]|uniref:Pro-Pol polyprotein n=1 Tax=Trichonephila clavipes TaxID=2585209 RepID=A0A8X6R631_TRICX|nr:pro-Pol polyprotein [Trichonephila clavipes]
MWSMVAQRLTQIAPPAATPDQLWQRVEAAWFSVPQEHIQSHFELMPIRRERENFSRSYTSGWKDTLTPTTTIRENTILEVHAILQKVEAHFILERDDNIPQYGEILVKNVVLTSFTQKVTTSLDPLPHEWNQMNLDPIHREWNITNIWPDIKKRDIHPICCKIDGKLPIYYCSLRKVNSFESLCDLLISDKLFETLNKETATHIGIREAEDWFRPIDLAKECDIYISSRSGSRKETPIACGYTEDPFKNRPRNYKPKIRDNYPQYLERQNKNCYICGDSSHYARDLLCKKVNGAMKTSSVDSNSQSPTPSPMKTKHSRFAMLRRLFEPSESVLNGRPEL